MILYPLATEKSLRQMESHNTLVFVVSQDSTKEQVKKEVEGLLGAKVERVRTLTDSKGRKKAYVKFSKETPAIDVATNLGLM